jgi:hypothetical protein
MSPTGFPSYPTPLRCFPDGEPVHSCGIKRVGGGASLAARCGGCKVNIRHASITG